MQRPDETLYAESGTLTEGIYTAKVLKPKRSAQQEAAEKSAQAAFLERLFSAGNSGNESGSG